MIWNIFTGNDNHKERERERERKRCGRVTLYLCSGSFLGKKMSEIESVFAAAVAAANNPSKLSPNQSTQQQHPLMPPPPSSGQSQPTMFSRQTSSMLISGKDVSSPHHHHLSPQSTTSAGSTSSTMSPVLFSPMSGSSAASEFNFSKTKKLLGPSEGAEVPPQSVDSGKFILNVINELDYMNVSIHALS